MTHFLVAFPLVRSAAAGVIGLTKPGKKKGHSITALQLDWRPVCGVLFNYTDACWASCQGLSYQSVFVIIQRWRNLLCCHNGRQLKVNQRMRKKRLSHVIRATLVSSQLVAHYVVDASGVMWQFTSNISVSPIMHLWGTSQVLVEIWMPDMESTAARAPIAQQSHLSQTTCTHWRSSILRNK